MRYTLVLILNVVLCVFPAWAAPNPAGPEEVSRQAQARLLSPCCYRFHVADHSSPEAAAMRAEIEALAQSGESEQQIVDFYKKRYGMRILAEPEGPAFWIATLVPIALPASGLLFLIRYLWGVKRFSPRGGQFLF